MTTRGRKQEEEKDPWGLDSGLVSDFDMTITKSRFGYLDVYQSGEACLLIWDYESPDVESEFPIIWPLGSGWETNRDGTKAEHPKRQRFVDTSFMGRLVKRCQDIGAADTLKARGLPRDATIWEGLSFHMVRENVVFPGGEERGIPSSVEHLMPVEFLSKEAAAPAPTRGRQAAATTATRRAAATATDVPAGAPQDSLVAKLTDLATTLERAAFQKAAMNIEALNASANRALLAEVLDDSDNGFWAKARQE